MKSPTDPDFPHGTATGRRYGCKCSPCVDASRRRAKTLRIARERGETPKSVRPHVGHRVRDHVLWLLEQAPGATGKTVARTAGVHDTTLTGIIRTPGRSMSPTVAGRLLNVELQAVLENRTRVPAAPTIARVRSLMALGYPLEWTGRTLSIHYLPRICTPSRSAQVKLIDKTAADAVANLYRSIGDRHATPRDGVSVTRSRAAKAVARRNRYHPPCAYDSGMNLVDRWVPGHPLARADELAHKRIEQAHALVKHPHLTHTELTELSGIPDHTIMQIKRRLGITALAETWLEDCARILDLIDGFYASDEDPVYFALSLGVLRARQNVPKTHPGLEQWLRDRERTAAA